MKLNKKGWGTLEMLILSACLLFALVVAIYFISRLYGSLDLVNENKYYVDIESKFEKAAYNFINNNNIEVDGEYKISYKTLKDTGFINAVYDKDGSECNGYVIVTRLEYNNMYKSHIWCNGYQSDNY